MFFYIFSLEMLRQIGSVVAILLGSSAVNNDMVDVTYVIILCILEKLSIASEIVFALMEGGLDKNLGKNCYLCCRQVRLAN